MTLSYMLLSFYDWLDIPVAPVLRLGVIHTVRMHGGEGVSEDAYALLRVAEYVRIF